MGFLGVLPAKLSLLLPFSVSQQELMAFWQFVSCCSCTIAWQLLAALPHRLWTSGLGQRWGPIFN